jgi:signal transduction histidine kinase
MEIINTNEFYDTIDLIITPVILSTNDTKSQFVNRAFLSQIGYTVADIPDQNAWFEKAYPNENYRNEVKQSWELCLVSAKTKGETHVHRVARICCADGTFKWFDVHENIFGDYKVVTFLEVDELQKSNEELVALLEQKDILLSVMAHDVRSPLSNIRQIFANFKEMDLSEDEIGGIFSNLDTQIEHIFNMVNSLLLRTSGEMGIFEEKTQTVHLKDFFLKYPKYYLERVEKQHIDFVFELADGDTINFDPFILDVIARNLIDNVIKFTPENGKIYISFEKKADSSDLIIRDTVVGMSEKQRGLILNNTDSMRLKNQASDSFGLGLVMAKEILEKHRGKLSIKSDIDKGTTFIINILDN